MSDCQCCIILKRLCGKSEALHALAAQFTPSMQAGSNFSLNVHLHHLQVQQQRFPAEMKSHIPGTSEHKLKKQEENVHQDAKSSVYCMLLYCIFISVDAGSRAC